MTLETEQHKSFVDFTDDSKTDEKIIQLIKDVKQKMEDRKEKEIERITSIFIGRDVDEKTIHHLSKLLISLFGRTIANKEYMKFVRTKQVKF